MFGHRTGWWVGVLLELSESLRNNGDTRFVHLLFLPPAQNEFDRSNCGRNDLRKIASIPVQPTERENTAFSGAGGLASRTLWVAASQQGSGRGDRDRLRCHSSSVMLVPLGLLLLFRPRTSVRWSKPPAMLPRQPERVSPQKEKKLSIRSVAQSTGSKRN